MQRLILFLSSTLVVFLAALLYRKPVGKKQRRALLLSYAGIVLVFGANPEALSSDTALGSLLVFGSAITFAVYLTGSGNLIPRFGSRRFTAYSMSVACVVTDLHFQVFFANSSAEANEGAVKLARKWGEIHRNGAFKIFTFENGFHGRTLAMTSTSGKAG
jgi:drug/metabolite transporter (DMT)-like permease